MRWSSRTTIYTVSAHGRVYQTPVLATTAPAPPGNRGGAFLCRLSALRRPEYMAPANHAPARASVAQAGVLISKAIGNWRAIPRRLRNCEHLCNCNRDIIFVTEIGNSRDVRRAGPGEFPRTVRFMYD